MPYILIPEYHNIRLNLFYLLFFFLFVYVLQILITEESFVHAI